MLLAMGITAFLCIFIGAYPAPLYALLPYEVSYEPYTTTHVVTQLQLLFFSALAFTVLMRTGIYPPELKSVNLDFDWTYRRLGPLILAGLRSIVRSLWNWGADVVGSAFQSAVRGLYNAYGPDGRVAKVWPTGSMVLWIAVLLGATLLVNFVP